MNPCSFIFNLRKCRKKILLLFFLLPFSFLTLIGQTISVDDTTNSTEELVDLLIGNNCIIKSNFIVSSSRSVAYFNNNNGQFPISEGVIIRNGIATHTEGSYTNSNLSSEISTNGDAQLQAISDENGQTEAITDVAFLEFNFIPLANNFSFNFLFASNEYGEYQCSFSDVFAIILTNINTGEAVNLAVLPDTTTNVSVQNIRDNQYNNSCSSINSALFDTYNVNNTANSSLNMRGHTVALNASAEVIPGSEYKIKFAIGDYNDSDFDSAVFIQAGSLDSSFSLGEDLTICNDEEVPLDSGFINTTDYSFVWQKDGNTILGETNPILNISETGTYNLTVTNLNTNCILNDDITVRNLQTNPPNNLIECFTTGTISFDLTLNNQTVLGIDSNEYDVFYYNSLENANNNIPIDQTELENYSGLAGETIYIKLRNKNNNSFCNTILDFNLIISEIEATIPNDISVCESQAGIDIPSEVESQILNGLSSTNHTINYFTSLSDANNNTNAIVNPTAYTLPSGSNSIAIWARLINNINCFDIVNFNINVSSLPLVDTLFNAFVCSEYVLPDIVNGNYFTGPNGTGNQLFAGDLITEQSTIYIYNENSDGCSNQKSFIVFIAEEYNPRLEYCGQYNIPSYENAQFYTAPNGPNGTGTVIPTGTALTASQTIYFYVEIDDVFCLEKEFPIVIQDLPSVDTFDNVITCDSYTLPQITNGNYFTGTNGSGTQLNVGDQITLSSTIYTYTTDNLTTCSNQNSFNVTIINPSAFQDFSICGSYTIPNTTIGSYYTEPNGVDLISPGTILTTSQTIYYFVSEITTGINCTENIPINVTIDTNPLVDNLQSVINCVDTPYTLPTIVNGNYFTLPNGQGTQLNTGDLINTTQTIYIFNDNGICTNESSFEVEIKPLPLVDNFIDIFRCDSYELPPLNNGNYFTEAGGQGTQLNVGDIIETTQTIYIYNQDIDVDTCYSENVFELNIFNIEVDEPENVKVCEPYMLPSLTVGNYFTESGGLGTQLNAGDIIDTSQTIYVYAENNHRFKCTDEHVFTVGVFETPNLTIQDIDACGSVTLPTLSTSEVAVEYYRNPNRVDLIDPSEYTITDIGPQTIYFYTYPTGNPNCFLEGFFQIEVYPLLDLEIQGGSICVDHETDETRNPFLLQSQLDPNEFTVNWFLDGELVGTGKDYNAVKAGVYTVETIKLNIEVPPNCRYNSTEVTVEESSPKFEISFLTNDFVDFYVVEINDVNFSLGNYVYALDNGNFQNSNRFNNVSPGSYTITVRDLSGICGDFFIDFTALDYPKFFTPNNDGVNDTWNIKDLKNDLNATIKIYSRLGRLVSIIKPSGPGWNGFNNNGNKEQSTDYWFLVEYTKGKGMAQFKANFSMLRR